MCTLLREHRPLHPFPLCLNRSLPPHCIISSSRTGTKRRAALQFVGPRRLPSYASLTKQECHQMYPLRLVSWIKTLNEASLRVSCFLSTDASERWSKNLLRSLAQEKKLDFVGTPEIQGNADHGWAIMAAAA